METTTLFAKQLFDGEKIEKNVAITIEKENIVEIEKNTTPKGERYEFITPAFIDAHSHIGLERHGECSEESDTNDRGESIWPHLSTIDGIQMDDRSFKLSIKSGVLYSCVLPGSGNIIGGKGVVIKNWEKNTTKAFIKECGYKAALGYNPKTTEEWKGKRPTTRQGVVAILREGLEKALQNKKLIEKGKKEFEELDSEEQLFLKLINREEKLRVHLHKTDDLFALLRIVDKYNIHVTIDHGCSLNQEEAFKALNERNIAIVYGPLDSFAYKNELMHETPKNVRYLTKMSLFSLMSDHPVIMQHLLFYTTRWLLTYSTKETALKSITSNAAKIVGLQNIGKIKQGYKASLLLWNENPFSFTFPQPIAEGTWIETEL